MAATSGILYAIQITWTRANKEKLLQRYKPGTAAHEATVRNLSSRRRTASILVAIISILLCLFLVHLIRQQYSGSAPTIIRVSLLISAMLMLLPIYAVYAVFRKTDK